MTAFKLHQFYQFPMSENTKGKSIWWMELERKSITSLGINSKDDVKILTSESLRWYYPDQVPRVCSQTTLDHPFGVFFNHFTFL
jgi:hypothetical protein